MTRIKICGITNLHDGLVAVAAGADALGFVFVPNTPRFVPKPQVQFIIKQLPPFVTSVGLFLDADLTEIKDAINYCQLNVIQLHGKECPDMCHQLGRQTKVIKSFHVNKESEIWRNQMENYQVDAYLLDTFVPGKVGGTGITFDWRLAEGLDKRIILAGGLAPDNIGSAVEQVQPYGVDVSSGVETSPGEKNADKIHSFIRQVRQIDYRKNNKRKM